MVTGCLDLSVCWFWYRVFHRPRPGVIAKFRQASGLLFIGFSKMGMENILYTL